jgi:hypothetical protein
MLTAKLVQRIRTEVPGEDGFFLSGTEEEFMNAARYLKDTLKAIDDDIINMLSGLYVAVGEEYGA